MSNLLNASLSAGMRAGVTVIPNRHGPYADLDKGKLPEIRVTPEWFHAQLTKLVTKSMDLLDDGDMEENIPVQAGDVVIIPESMF